MGRVAWHLFWNSVAARASLYPAVGPRILVGNKQTSAAKVALNRDPRATVLMAVVSDVRSRRNGAQCSYVASAGIRGSPIHVHTLVVFNHDWYEIGTSLPSSSILDDYIEEEERDGSSAANFIPFMI